MSVVNEIQASRVAAAMLPLFSLPRLPAKSVQLLLLIAANPGINVAKLSARTATPHSTVSRLLMDLGPRNRHKEDGHGLIEIQQEENFHNSSYYLTAKGEKLVAKMLKTMVDS